MKQKSLHIHYQVFKSADELDNELQLLTEAAKNSMHRAYAPYSEFRVGAALLLDDNSIVEGNNQENAAYPSGLCAERVALFYAGAQFPNKKVKAVAVIAHSEKLHKFDDVVSPCGACRQVMLETQSRQKENIQIILISVKGNGVIFESVEDLLPFFFDSSSLLSES